MNIAYFHASEFGNGVLVAAEFQRIMRARGMTVTIQHVKEANPKTMPRADLYVFSSPGRYGKPIKTARKFLEAVTLPPGTKYALLTTEMGPQPNKKTGLMPTEAEMAEMAKWQRVRPIMNELLQAKGLAKIAEEVVHVVNLKGPLEQGWQRKVEAFADRLCPPQLQVA